MASARLLPTRWQAAEVEKPAGALVVQLWSAMRSDREHSQAPEQGLCQLARDWAASCSWAVPQAIMNSLHLAQAGMKPPLHSCPLQQFCWLLYNLDFPLRDRWHHLAALLALSSMQNQVLP